MCPSPLMCPDLRAGQPIPLDELKAACAEYDERCKEGVDYNEWLRVFREAVGIDMGDDDSQFAFDLREHEHGAELILLLNRWGTHVPSRVPVYYERLLRSLSAWSKALGENPAPRPKARLADIGLDLGEVAARFASLRDIPANARQRFSHVAASKTLYFARPHVFVAWDNAIMDALRYRKGSVAEYVDYLQGVRDTLRAIQREHGAPRYDLDDLPGEIGQTGLTAAEVINKFYWVKAHPQDG